MALRALKLLSFATESTLKNHNNFQLSTILVKRFASNKQDQSQAFWDEEGASEVDLNKPSNRKPLDSSGVSQKPPAEPEPGDVVRYTQFGHVRFDSDNIPTEFAEETSDSLRKSGSGSLNFIDEQFFGIKSNKQSTSASESPTLSKDVPRDTNTVDQQYFYPSQAEKDTKSFKGPPPSASELDFSENEVDNQYFGSAASKTSEIKKNPLRVSAFDYVYSKVQDPNEKKKDVNTENSEEHWKKYRTLVPELYKLPDEVICSILKKNILYNKDGVVALDKPYGMVTTDADRKAPIVLTKYLPQLCEKLRYEKLYTVHRLDRDTTGVLLLASNQKMAMKLQEMFANHEIKKKYLAITKGIPSPREGTVDIPLYEKTVFDRERMALRPVLPHSEDTDPSYNTKVKSHRALTHFRVIRSAKSAAFMELEPETGVRHQLRVHLSEALNCPIIGDHKYSYADKYVPQKLPQDILDCLKIKQSKVRHVPMHLHATFVSIPGLGLNGQPLEIRAPLHPFFRYTLKKLGLYSSKS